MALQRWVDVSPLSAAAGSAAFYITIICMTCKGNIQSEYEEPSMLLWVVPIVAGQDQFITPNAHSAQYFSHATFKNSDADFQCFEIKAHFRMMQSWREISAKPPESGFNAGTLS